MRPTFPFTAIVGQSRLKVALQLISIDPQIGGVLISGPRGSAKSTVVRSLAHLNHDQPFVTVPLGASEEMIVGSFDLEKALNDAKVAFKPGLLARANAGILYVDEVNLLADNLVDLLLDASASGVNLVERDGISHEHAAEFVLVGTMNPDEGELRPQLLDRFGLIAELDTMFSIQQRQQVVRQRLEFDQNPEETILQHQNQLGEVQARLQWAKQHLSSVRLSAEISETIARRCADAHVEGFRADITLHRAACAHAALDSRLDVTVDDIDQVEALVLDHRRHGTPPAPPPPAGGGSSGSTDPSTRNQGGSSIQGSWGAMQTVSVDTADARTLSTQHRTDTSGTDTGQTSALTTSRKGNTLSSRFLSQRGKGRAKVDWFRSLKPVARRTQDNQSANTRELQYRYAQQRAVDLNLILLDTSASTLGGKGLAQAKGLLKELSRQSYIKREQLCIVTFGNDQVSTLLHPQRAPKNIQPKLDSIRAGGGTPITRALDYASSLLSRWRHRHFDCSIYLVTDGRLDRSSTHHSLFTAHHFTIIDIESSRVKLGLARQLAAAISARYLHVSALPLAST